MRTISITRTSAPIKDIATFLDKLVNWDFVEKNLTA